MKLALVVIFYVALFPIAVVTPVLAFALVLAAMLVANSYQIRAETPLLRSDRSLIRVLGWLLSSVILVGVALLQLLVGFWTLMVLLAVVLDLFHSGTEVFAPQFLTFGLIFDAWTLPVLVVSVVVAIWGLVGTGEGDGRSRVGRLLTLWLLPPLGIAWLKGSAQPQMPLWRRLAWAFAIICWLRLYMWLVLGLLAGWVDQRGLRMEQVFFGLTLRYLVFGAVLVLVAVIVRLGYRYAPRPQPEVTDMGAESAGTTLVVAAAPPGQGLTRPLRAIALGRTAGGSAVFVLGWALPLAVAALPWALLVTSELAKAKGTDAVLKALIAPAAIFLAALPIAAVSFVRLVAAINTGRRADSWMAVSRAASPALGTALVVALVVILSGVMITSLRADSPWLAQGLCIGLSTGLSVGVAQAFRQSGKWVEVSTGLVATIFILLLFFNLLVADNAFAQWPGLPGLPWFKWPLLGAIGLVIGFLVGDFLLVPGFIAFTASTSYVSELFWDLVGFVAGYMFIGLLFTALYYGMYSGNSGWFHLTGDSPKNLQTLTIGDFAYFSMNTITPLGYTDIRPNNRAVEVLTLLELALGIGWTVVVFGTVLTRLTERHIRRMLEEIGAVTRPGEARAVNGGDGARVNGGDSAKVKADEAGR